MSSVLQVWSCQNHPENRGKARSKNSDWVARKDAGERELGERVLEVISFNSLLAALWANMEMKTVQGLAFLNSQDGGMWISNITWNTGEGLPRQWQNTGQGLRKSVYSLIHSRQDWSEATRIAKSCGASYFNKGLILCNFINPMFCCIPFFFLLFPSQFSFFKNLLIFRGQMERFLFPWLRQESLKIHGVIRGLVWWHQQCKAWWRRGCGRDAYCPSSLQARE